MNASKLKALHLLHSPESQFFARETMRFFGDTMQNFGVKKQESGGDWVLYRKRQTAAPADVVYLFRPNGEFIKCVAM